MVTLRKATLEDAELLLGWRNDLKTRAASHNSAEVSGKDHALWLEKTLLDSKSDLFIAEEAGYPVGTARADYDYHGCEISWTVAPHARGRGLGKALVSAMVDKYKCRGLIRAEIKKGNAASVKIAEQAGLLFEREADGVLYYRKEANLLD